MAARYAIITGAASGIGFELALRAAMEGFELLISADVPHINNAAMELGRAGTSIRCVEADLCTAAGVERLLGAHEGRPVDMLCITSAASPGDKLLEQDFSEWRRVIDANLLGSLLLLRRVLPDMIARKTGRVLLAGAMARPTSLAARAIQDGTNSFLEGYATALREELTDLKTVSLTTLMPAKSDAGLSPSDSKDDPSPGKLARDGWEAVMDRKPRLSIG